MHASAPSAFLLKVESALPDKGYQIGNRDPVNGHRPLDRPAPSRHKASRKGGVMDFISILSIFVLACFVGYYVVWSVTPALHTPLMSVTNAISSVIIVGGLIAAAAGAGGATAKWLGLGAVVLASINIFGGFAVTQRMLAMYKKKERKDA